MTGCHGVAISDFGALSLVPPMLAILLAIATRRPILSLFLGVWAGGVIASGSLGSVQTFDWITGSIADVFHAQILVFTLLLGSGVALIRRLGGAMAVSNWAADRLETQRSTNATTWLLGMVLFIDDYANTAIVGSTMRELSDRLRISREKLSYIVDSTAAPVATIGISSWVAFQLSMVREGFDEIEAANGVDAPSVFGSYLHSIPYNAYALLAIVMVGIVVFSGVTTGKCSTRNTDRAPPGRSPGRTLFRSNRSRPSSVNRSWIDPCFGRSLFPSSS